MNPQFPTLTHLDLSTPARPGGNFCWYQATTRSPALPSTPHPCPYPLFLPFTLSFWLFAPVRHTQDYESSSESNPGSEIPPASKKIPHVYVGEGLTRDFLGLLTRTGLRHPGNSQHLQQVPSSLPSSLHSQPHRGDIVHSQATAVLGSRCSRLGWSLSLEQQLASHSPRAAEIADSGIPGWKHWEGVCDTIYLVGTDCTWVLGRARVRGGRWGQH